MTGSPRAPARRLRLTADALAVLAEALPEGARLPPGALPAAPADRRAASAALRDAGLVGASGAHPALRASLLRLAAPELAVLVDLHHPRATASAAVAVRGALGTALVRAGDDVELSAFPSAGLAAELARVVPPGTAVLPSAGTLPLEALADPDSPLAGGLHARAEGSLRALVLGGAGPVGIVDWVWLAGPGGAGGGWAALEPVPAPGAGPAQVRLRPVGPPDLAVAVAPSAALLLAGSAR